MCPCPAALQQSHGCCTLPRCPGKPTISVCSFWVLARFPLFLPSSLPPSDPLSHGTALCCRAIPTPWKYAAVKPLNQLEGTRSEVYLEKGCAVCEPALTHFSGTGGTGLPSIPPSLPSARGRLGRPTQTLRIRACSGEHVLSINKATERQKIISRNTKDFFFPPQRIPPPPSKP